MEPMDADEEPTRIADRYQVLRVLGRGGMGVVYQVRDESDGSELALKRLVGREGRAPDAHTIELFEREYHTLNGLAHPRVVRAFDYSVDGTTPFYTLELLDGGDLRDRVPLPWEQACSVAYDICSVLSLLHSRQLVHRDLTPRNIRLTGEGKAKLMDFGLLSPMGPIQQVAGTPAYTAPEVLHQVSLDGRCDLFSLGCTLYSSLTGCAAFSARRFGELRDVWRRTPVPVATLVPDVPDALAQLVTELMRLDVDARPRSAAEVMDRLRPLLPRPPDETLSVARAHLSAPALVARGAEHVRIRKQMMRAARGRGGGFLITAPPGTGRSRMLDVFVLEAKLLGGIAARAGGAETVSDPFFVAQCLANQIHEQAPSASVEAARDDAQVRMVLFGEQDLSQPALCRPADLSRPELEGAGVQAALHKWVLAVAAQRPVALAVDDLERVDEESASLLAVLSLAASTARLAYAVVCVPGRPDTPALSVLDKHARRVPLAPLAQDETKHLLRTVFGDVRHLHATSHALHALSAGKPRDCMLLAQHLVDQRVITYESGGWRLPERVDPSALPASMGAALAEQVARLSPLGLEVARTLSIGMPGRLSLSELRAVTDVSPSTLDAALDELRQAHLLVGGAEGYALVHEGASAQVVDGWADAPAVHDRLADLLEEAGAPMVVVAHHRLRGRAPLAGAAGLAQGLRQGHTDDRMAWVSASTRAIGFDACAAVLADADDVARAGGLGVGVRFVLWPVLRGVVALGADAVFFDRIPADYLCVLEQDSGLSAWRELADLHADPAARALAAFAAANERYQDLPEADRVLAPVEAIEELARYVSVSFLIASRFCDSELMASLPGLLSPFAHLHPLVGAIHASSQLSQLTVTGRYEAARDLTGVLQTQLDTLEGDDRAYVQKLRDACWLNLRLLDIVLGIEPSDHDSVSKVSDPEDKVHAAHLEAVAAGYRGDRKVADAYRQRAEWLSLEHRATGLFTPLKIDLEVYAALDDVTGVRETCERIGRLVENVPGWRGWHLLAEAHYRRLLGERERALGALAQLRAHFAGKSDPSREFYWGVALEVELLSADNRPEEARARGQGVLDGCTEEGPSARRRTLSCALALADSALGDHVGARARVQAAIADQQRLGVSHFFWGRSHEYLARIAINEGDAAGFEAAVRVVARRTESRRARCLPAATAACSRTPSGRA